MCYYFTLIQGQIKTVGGLGPNFLEALDCNLYYLFSYLYGHSNALIFTRDIKHPFNHQEAAGSYSTTHQEKDESHCHDKAVRSIRHYFWGANDQILGVTSKIQ